MKINISKFSVIPGILLLVLFIASCENNEQVDLSENSEARDDVYEQILNDEQLFAGFMNELRENRKSMEWMDNNRPMMNHFYGRERMHNMMRKNPQMRDSLMQVMFASMEKDKTMRSSPQTRERMLRHISTMMQRDTAFARQMRQMAQQATAGMGM